MKRIRLKTAQELALFLLSSFPSLSHAWHDETHLAIAKAAGYYKWYNAAGADIAKIKAGDKENFNHYSNNPPNTSVTPETVLAQVNRYNDPTDENGHLYGTIIASLRDYRSTKTQGKFAEYHMGPIALIMSGACPCRFTTPCTMTSIGSTTQLWMGPLRMRS